MRAWLIANRYAVSAVALTALCIVALAMLVQPAACASPSRRASTPTPAPTQQPALDIQPQATSTASDALTAPDADSKNYVGDSQLAMPGEKYAGGALLTCSSGGDLDWSTTADAFQVVCRCTITLPADGWAYLSAGASVAGHNCEYEAHFRLGIDRTEGDPATDRSINVYGDTGDGMDAVLAVSALRPLKAGPHTFYLLCRRESGAGAVLLHDPSLAVLAGQ